MEIYDRIATTDGQLGTVKYIGTLPDHIWGVGTLAFGIEWDNWERGKNNGSIDGIGYFRTEVEAAGSFIKANSKKISPQRSTFVDAILQEYSINIHFDKKIEFNTKIVESYGFEKLNYIQSNFENLVSVSLDKKHVYKSFDNLESFTQITNSLRNVEHLDLSYNLINDFKDICEIVHGLRSLKSLNLNGNRFYKKNIDTTYQHLPLKTLLLATTNITLTDLTTFVFPKFRYLTEISLSSTRLTDHDFKSFEITGVNLISVDLSFNNLTKIPECFSTTSIKVLNLSDNRIELTKGIFSSIKSLDLRNNRIDSWDVIDRLSNDFGNVSDLRVNGNPLFEKMSEDEAYLNIIARFYCQVSKNIDESDKLCKLNGSFILEDDLSNADLFFISQVKQGSISYNLNSKRWKYLIKKYNIAPTSHLPLNLKGRHDSKKILLHFKLQNETFSRIFLRSNTILRVKGIIARKLEKCFIDINLYYYVNDDNNDENSKMYLDELNIIDDYGLESEQTIYIS